MHNEPTALGFELRKSVGVGQQQQATSTGEQIFRRRKSIIYVGRVRIPHRFVRARDLPRRCVEDLQQMAAY